MADKNSKLLDFPIRKRKIIVFIVLALTVFFGILAFKTPLDMGMYNLLPENDPIVQQFKQVSANYGGFDLLIVNISGSNSVARQRVADLLAPELSKLSDIIQDVDYKVPMDYFKKNYLLYMPRHSFDKMINISENILSGKKQLTSQQIKDALFKDQNKISGFNLNQGYYTTPDGKELLMFLRPTNPNHDMLFFKKMVEKVEEKLFNMRFQDVSVNVLGMPKMMVEQQEFLNKKLLMVSLISGTGILLLFLLFFKNFSSTLGAMIPVIIGIIWTLGINFLVIGRLNLVTSIFSVMLLGLGVDFSIHFVSHYFDEIRQGRTKEDAIRKVFSTIGRSLSIGALTTSAAFYLLMFSQFKGLKELGFIAGTGVLFCLIMVYLLIPSILIILQRPKILEKKSLPISATISEKLIKYKIPIVLFTIILMTVPLILGLKVDYNYNAFSLLPDIPSVRSQNDLMEKMNMSFDYNIVQAGSIEESREQYGFLTNLNLFSFVDSLVLYLPADQKYRLKKLTYLYNKYSATILFMKNFSKNRDVTLFIKLIESTINKGPLRFENLPIEIQQKYQGKDKSYGTFAYGKIDMWGEASMRRTVTELQKLHSSSSGSSFMWLSIVEYIKSDFTRSVLLVLLVILLIVTIDFKNPLLVILVFVPVGLTFLGLIEIMSLLGIKFNAANIAAFPIILGIGIDDGIHLVRSYLTEGVKNITPMLRKSGKAVLVTSLTTMIAFGSLYFVSDPLVSGLGVLLFLGVGLALIISTVLLPVLLYILRDKLSKYQKPLEGEAK